MDATDGSPSGSGAVTPDHSGGGARRWAVLLPAATFLVGTLLGAAVVGAGAGGDDADAPPAAVPSASPAPAAGENELLVRVPGPCVQVADRTEEAYALLDRGVTAARDLDAGALAGIADEVQRQRPEVQALIEQCRTAAGRSVVEPAPTP